MYSGNLLIFKSQPKMKSTTIQTAITLGFDFSQLDNNSTIDEINHSVIEFLNEHSDELESVYDECEVTSHGRSQNVSYGDFSSSGEIIDWSYYNYKERQKIEHSNFLFINDEGTPKKMILWCWSKDEEAEIN